MTHTNSSIKKPEIDLDSATERIMALLAQATVCGGKSPGSGTEQELIKLLARYGRQLVHILTEDPDTPYGPQGDPDTKSLQAVPKTGTDDLIDKHARMFVCAGAEPGCEYEEGNRILINMLSSFAKEVLFAHQSFSQILDLVGHPPALDNFNKAPERKK